MYGIHFDEWLVANSNWSYNLRINNGPEIETLSIALEANKSILIMFDAIESILIVK